MSYDTKRIPASSAPSDVEEGRIPTEDRQTVAGHEAHGWEVFMVTSGPDPKICLRRPTDFEAEQDTAEETADKEAKALPEPGLGGPSEEESDTDE